MIAEFTALRALVDERDVRYQQRFEGSQRALDAARTADSSAVHAALEATKEAIGKAELAAERRFELLNELRTGVATRDQVDALEKVVSALSRRMDLSEGHSGGRRDNRAGIYAAIAAVGVLMAIITAVARVI